ncbi:MAG: glycosyltransferase family 2 protein [Thermoanaerobaculia bacterium]|nr:glycosyltransferase family 2 protein [Thermoanaerobaculia bacterium]
MLRVSVVLPVYNEEGSLHSLDAELRAVLGHMGDGHEIIYVDDRSTDNSYDILSELMSVHRDHGVTTRVVRLRRNFGQTAAMAAGFHLATGDVVVPMDADGQNNPADIPKLLGRIEEGFDVVSGWRRQRRDRVDRVILSRAANWLIAQVSGVQLHDTGCSLKAYRRELLEEIHLYGEMHRFIPVYLARQGARVTEIEVDHRPRTEGVSKYGSERIFKVVLDLILLLYVSRYFARPMHFFGQVAFFFGISATAVFSLMVIFKFGWLDLVGLPYQADFIETPLPSMAGTFFATAVTALLLGVLGELLVRIYFETEGHQPFAVDRIDGKSSRSSKE